jgi:aminoglycoside 6-adenylyltransferase
MTPNAERLLRTVADWAAARDDLRLVVVLGSQARLDEPADEFSDLDMVLSSTDHRYYLDDPSWLAALGSPVLTFIEPTATGGEFERRVLFDTGLDVDFSVLPHARMQAMLESGFPPDIQSVVARGLRVVIDKDGLAPRLLQHAQAGAPAWAPPGAGEFNEKTNDFLYHCVLAARKAARGELFVAIASLDGFLRRYLFDAIKLHRRLTSDVSTAWYGARMIER